MTRLLHPLAVLMVSLLALTACSKEYNLTKSSDADGRPAMVVNPHRLEFFGVSTGETAVESFTVADAA